MAGVVELRVHGVGGTPPEGLLGEPRPAGLVRVGGDDRSAFFARVREGRRVEGYAWGPLTASGLIQPLWIFLLPFTLVNVAGWMLPGPSTKWNRVLWKVARVVIELIGVGLTLSFLYGVSVLITRQVFFGWAHLQRHVGRKAAGLPENGINDPELAIWLGTAVVGILGVVTFLVSRRKQRQFEEVPNPVDAEPSEGIIGTTRAAITALLDEDQGLGTARLWSAGGVRWLLGLHVLAAAGALAWLTFQALGSVENGGEHLGWGGGLIGLSWVLLGFVILLAFLLVAGWGKSVLQTGSFRFLGPCVVISTAIGLSAGLFVGAALLLQDWLSLKGSLEVDLGLAFGTASLSTVVAGACVAIYLLGRATREAFEMFEAGEPPVNNSAAGEEPNGIPEGRHFGVARARALSEFGRNTDIILTVPAVFFGVFMVLKRWLSPGDRLPVISLVLVLVGGMIVFFLSARPKISRRTGRATVTLMVVLWVAMLVAALIWGEKVTISTLAQLGGSIATFGTLAFLGFWIRGYFKPEQRRLIGIIWDVTGFFPRHFHPLAVRPYSQRAVPELIGRLRHHLDSGTKVILSAHSQGTVIAVAALAQIRRYDLEQGRESLRRVAFVTYGSPLSQLHARFFPAYFSREVFDGIDDSLFDGTVAIEDTARAGSWQNFYRLTDYIGKRVTLTEDPTTRNTAIQDPPNHPMYGDPPGEVADDAGPDPFRPAWVEMCLHSHYNSERELKRWVRGLRETLDNS